MARHRVPAGTERGASDERSASSAVVHSPAMTTVPAGPAAPPATPAAPVPPSPPSPRAGVVGGRGRRLAGSLLTLAAWVVLIVVARRWARAVEATGKIIRLHAPPLVGWDRWRINGRLAIPVAVALVLVTGLPRWSTRLAWRRLLALTYLASAAWAVSLAVTDGWLGITRPTLLPHDEYLLDVGRVGNPHSFLLHFTANIGHYVTHVRSHPPGVLLLLWGMDRIGLGGPRWAAALFIAGGAAAFAAVLVVVRRVAGEDMARRAMPFLVLSPAALWVATTADAFYAGAAAWAVVAVVLSMYRDDRRGDVLALVGGIGFGLLAHLAYGAVLVGLVPLAIAVHRRRIRPLLIAAAGSVIVVAAFTSAGFFIVDGLRATHRQYLLSVARDRSYRLFFVVDWAALAVVVGPAIAVALVRLRDRRVWLLVGAALSACLVAAVSGAFKGEVERIWLPFSVWVLAAGAALALPPGATRAPRRSLHLWLAVQATFATLVQVGIHTRW